MSRAHSSRLWVFLCAKRQRGSEPPPQWFTNWYPPGGPVVSVCIFCSLQAHRSYPQMGCAPAGGGAAPLLAAGALALNLYWLVHGAGCPPLLLVSRLLCGVILVAGLGRLLRRPTHMKGCAVWHAHPTFPTIWSPPGKVWRVVTFFLHLVALLSGVCYFVLFCAGYYMGLLSLQFFFPSLIAYFFSCSWSAPSPNAESALGFHQQFSVFFSVVVVIGLGTIIVLRKD